MLGVWKGYYKHESKNIPKERRVQKTYFTIEITKFNNNKFEGEISEDKKSGGMNGVGSIIGSQKNDKITFIKQMPIETILLKDETIQIKKKHPKLYYKGNYNKTDKKFSGTWKFKFGFTRIDGKFAIRLPIKGVWKIEKA